MPEVFTPSTVIRIHFPENVWSNRIPNIYMWYRTLRQNRWHRWRWMMSMHCRLPAVPIRIMKNWEEFRRPQRSSSVWSATGAVLADAASAHWPSTRGGSYRHEVTNLCCRRQRRSRRILILRDISMMWADRLQISGIHPVKSRWPKACVRQSSVCSRHLAKTWMQITKTM